MRSVYVVEGRTIYEYYRKSTARNARARVAPEKGNERPSFSRTLTLGIQQVRASVPVLPNAKGNFVPIEGF